MLQEATISKPESGNDIAIGIIIKKYSVELVKERMIGLSTYKVTVCPALRTGFDEPDRELTVTKSIVEELCESLNSAYNTGRNDMALSVKSDAS